MHRGGGLVRRGVETSAQQTRTRNSHHWRANVAHIRQQRLDSGLGFQANFLKPLNGFLFPR